MRCLPVVALALILAACASIQPIPVRSGDTCYRCREPITEVRLATELVTTGGHAFKFKCPDCMAKYLAEHPEEQPKAVFVTDYPSGKMLRAEAATYVRFEVNPDRREMEYAAFRDVQAAAEFAKQNKATATDWPGVLRMTKAG